MLLIHPHIHVVLWGDIIMGKDYDIETVGNKCDVNKVPM